MAIKISACPFSDEDILTVQNNLLNNIATVDHVLTKMTQSTVYESMPSVVIAAPAQQSATFSQDYYFYWVRDGAIAMNQVVYLYAQAKNPADKSRFKNYLLDYLKFVAKVQSQPALNNVDILGEPKFNIDGTLWTGVWARPQNDGAAFQAITLIHIARAFLAEGETQLVAQIYTPDKKSLLKANLEYCAANWMNPCAGPWEELTGCHFSVRAVQRRALLEGATLARILKDPGAGSYYDDQALHLENALSTYWDPALGYCFQTYKEEDIRGGGLGCSLLSGFVDGRNEFSLEDGFGALTDRALGTAFYVRNTFENLYQINAKDRAAKTGGPLIGRYQNDLYDGNQSIYGNPWFLGTHLMAGFYYWMARDLLRGAALNPSFLAEQFFHQIAPGLALGDKQAVAAALIAAGDEILRGSKAHAKTYADGSGLHMSEQINRLSGEQVSAPDLSWSYASLLDAVHFRAAAVAFF